MSEARKGIAQVVAATWLFSLVGPVAKLVAISAGAVSFWRAIFGGSALIVVALASRRASWRVTAVTRSLSLVLAGLFMCGNWYFYILAVKESTVAVAVVCLFTYPLLTALAEPVVFKERVRRGDVISGALVVVGVSLIVERYTLSDSTARGALFGLLSSVSLTARNLLTRRVVRLHPATTVTAYQFAVAAVVFSPMAFSHSEWPTSSQFLLLALLGGLLTMVSQTLFVASLRHLSTSFASILVSLQPIYAVAAAALLLDEMPRSRVLVGGTLVLSAVTLALATRTEGRPPHRGPSEP